ncbi:conserved Plasmodium protein, unknown function [Plasmodium knowlesi strain H]|uniref:Uncharacterized protein n=3 Tax=Plasmodium knowlesi TaxID=5850 RepID=A0A5K1ULS4_PLAKH|nr:conserved Plasmodium protein, unknown function [Plasmodium knowlesi strain H]OTN68322.1 Uncharacterized protein PKNOH_S03337800 [Plasmodium knowlesi]CAA9987274.1 conserved Plasmodium protein, unknown function [Plasmodium knowlesi strain H]SBO24050.1 conserved Plasmodium protein, unknown function [Plasmodium knowlesi strain H]SBO26083.1 conserved Plasmodium protein, unknown function [Plasmodium knowlesi strain H]VVS76748.1 conserved Plasmodium protein, unknown function [Plasmodium knowlesi s|eukprot:XP_002261896.1 hypothetical protein, conserved in Plasmodium species [Plasmodium knowlesi strain H]
MHSHTDILFSASVRKINKQFVKKTFCSSTKFCKNVKYATALTELNSLQNLNRFYIPPKHSIFLMQKSPISEQIIIDSIRKAQNELDRGSLYSLQELFNSNGNCLNEEKKAKVRKALDELNALLTVKSNLTEEKIQILTESNSDGYKNKEILGLFITGFFFAIGSVTHSVFYLVSVYGLYVLHKASKENDGKIYVERKLNENKDKLLRNKKNIQTILSALEQDLIKEK